MKKIVLTSLACLSLVSCGFTPMHGGAFQDEEARNIRVELQNIQISNIKDRDGQFLRNALIDRFYVDGRPINPKYTLMIDTIAEESKDLDITKNSDATRAQLRLSTRMALRDVNTGAIVLERDLKAITSYNVLTSEFATRVSEQAARENSLNDLARQAELYISLYLKR